MMLEIEDLDDAAEKVKASEGGFFVALHTKFRFGNWLYELSIQFLVPLYLIFIQCFRIMSHPWL